MKPKEMSEMKSAFVLMPFKDPFDSYYEAIFKPALESAGFQVSRADDLFTPRPIMLDIQDSILEADLILCDMSERNPNVFYELGLAHAIGKPAILLTRKEGDIPFDLRHIRAITYDYVRAGWEQQLRDDIASAAKSIDGSAEVWPPSLIATQDNHMGSQVLANEISFNLREIDRFLERQYTVSNNRILGRGKANVTFRYITCMTTTFESAEVQSGLVASGGDVKDDVFKVYRSLREINDRAEALKQVFRPWRAAQYLEAIAEFESEARAIAVELVNILAGRTAR